MTVDATYELPLAGVRALEVAEIWAGPYCGALLGDLGAQVIKVESLQRLARGPLNPRPGTAGYPDKEPGQRPWNRVANFNALNRNKLSITLDLASPEGLECFKDLVAVSDIVFSNYAFGVVDRLGIDYETLRRIKPDLLMVLMPGYGNTGPYKRYRSMGMTIDAVTGHSALRGYPDEDLSRLSLVHHADAVAGLTASFAICAALHYRARTGKGQFIDLSQAEAFMPHMGEIFLEYGLSGLLRERRGNRHPLMAPHGCYPSLGDDRWVTIAVRDEEEWQAFCQVLQMPDLVVDVRFSTLAQRLENRDALDEIVAGWTSARDRYQAAQEMQARGIPAGPVLNCGADTYDDPHLQAREYFQEVNHPDAGTHLLSGPIWKLDGAPGPLHQPAPCLGQDNNYILGRVLGLSDEALNSLEEKSVIGTVPLEGADMEGVRRIQRAN